MMNWRKVQDTDSITRWERGGVEVVAAGYG